MFSYEFCKTFKNTLSTEHLRTTASERMYLEFFCLSWKIESYALVETNLLKGSCQKQPPEVSYKKCALEKLAPVYQGDSGTGVSQ